MKPKTTFSRRTFLKGVAGGIATAGLAACTVPAAVPEAAGPAEMMEVDEIRVLVVGDPFQFALEKIIDNYAEASGVKVNLESLSYDALNARLAASFVSGSSDADVVTVDQMWNSQYYDNQWIVALDDYISGRHRHQHRRLHPAKCSTRSTPGAAMW